MKDNATDTSSVIKNFMQITETSEVFLYGGAAIDRYMNHNAKIMDYDIAISDPHQYTKAINKLRTLGFDVAKPRIAHNLSTVAKHPDYGVFDLACMDIQKNGIYNLDSTNKETDLTKCCHVLIQISNPNIETCVEIIKVKKRKLHYISLAELQEMMTHSVFEVELDLYSNFNNAIMLIGYIASHKIVFTIYESIDFRISFLE